MERLSIDEVIGQLKYMYKTCMDEKCKHKGQCDLCCESRDMAIQALEEIQHYRAIGTIEEFKALKEKSVPRKIKGIRFEAAICPRCESELFETYWAFGGIHYCSNCGQTIDWQ